MYKTVKRFLDFIFAVILIILLSPVFLLVSFLVYIKLGRPIIFKQPRPGLNSSIFTMYKFRTMTNESDSSGELLSDTERLTKFGRFLRSSSLDELPELFNILRGDMSFIGPRPLLVSYLPYYSDEESKRHSVRPGITGLSQINGRNALNWEERFSYDIQYVTKMSLVLDISIFLKTIIVVFKKENIGERGIDTPMDFNIYRSGDNQNNNHN